MGMANFCCRDSNCQELTLNLEGSWVAGSRVREVRNCRQESIKMGGGGGVSIMQRTNR
jgi:hypothetical protein